MRIEFDEEVLKPLIEAVVLDVLEGIGSSGQRLGGQLGISRKRRRQVFSVWTDTFFETHGCEERSMRSALERD